MSDIIEVPESTDLVGVTFPDALDKSGLDAKFMADQMYDCAVAKDDNGNPLYNVRLKSIDMALRCRGSYVDRIELSPGAIKTETKLENSIIEKIKGGVE